MSEVPATPALAAVICTYNNAAMPDGVLSMLACQSRVERARRTCLGADNSSTDDTPNVIARHVLAGAIADLRSAREPRQGLTSARLRGVGSTTAEWIAFADDDCFLQTGWIARAIAFAGSHSWAGAFGGAVLLDWEAEPPGCVRACGCCFADQNHGNYQRQVSFLAGAGLAVNRLALSARGWIDAPLLAHRAGEKPVSGGDVEIVLRIAGIGRQLWYVPQRVLNHRIPARRFSPGYRSDIDRNPGISQALADALVSEHPISTWLFESIRKAAKQTLALARVTFDVARQRRAVFIQASFRLGQLQGIWRVLTMSPSCRHELLGRVRPVSGRGLSRPGEAA